MMNHWLKSRPPKTRLTTGMIRSLTSESTILPNAAPMITPTARSITLPFTANSRNSPIIDMSAPYSIRVGRRVRTSSDRLLAAFAGPRRLDHRLDRAIDRAVGVDQRDLDLGQEVDDVFGAAIELRVTALTPEALDLRHGEPGDADLGKRFAYLVQLERLDDGFDLFHGGGNL